MIERARLRLSERSRRRESQIMYRIGRFGETWIINDGKLRIKRKVTAYKPEGNK